MAETLMAEMDWKTAWKEDTWLAGAVAQRAERGKHIRTAKEEEQSLERKAELEC